jgi:hypothetical protein
MTKFTTKADLSRVASELLAASDLGAALEGLKGKYTEAQAPMIAAMLLNTRRNNTGAQRGVNSLAGLFGVDRHSVGEARCVLDRGTTAEVASVLKGDVQRSTLAQWIRAGMSAAERATIQKMPKGARGKNPERLDRHRLETGLWHELRTGIEALNGLPAVADMLAIASKLNRGFLETNLSTAAKWLKEFEDGYRRQAQNQRNGAPHSAAHHDQSGDGDQAPGAEQA